MATAALLGGVPLSRERKHQFFEWKPSLQKQTRLAFPRNNNANLIKSCNLYTEYPKFGMVVEKSSEPPPPQKTVELGDKKTNLLNYFGGIAISAVRLVFIRKLRCAIGRDLSYLGPAFRVSAGSGVYVSIINWATIVSTVSFLLDMLPTARRQWLIKTLQDNWASSYLGQRIQKDYIDVTNIINTKGWGYFTGACFSTAGVCFSIAAELLQKEFDKMSSSLPARLRSARSRCCRILWYNIVRVSHRVSLILKDEDHWISRLLHVVLACGFANLIVTKGDVVIGLFKELYWSDRGALFTSRGFCYFMTVIGVARLVFLVVTFVISSEKSYAKELLNLRMKK